METTHLINYDSRTFYINGEIDTVNLSTVIFNIIHILQEDDLAEETLVDYERPPILIYITSVGGEINAMWALVDILLKSKTPVYTYAIGNVDSAALKIFLAGSQRYCYTHTSFVLHQLSAGITGTFTTMSDTLIDNYSIAQAQLEDYIMKRTKIDEDTLKDVRECNRDWVIRPEEALEYGIVDEIIDVYALDGESNNKEIKSNK